eukprot:5065306-Pyramimonas_sp.AAC.1
MRCDITRTEVIPNIRPATGILFTTLNEMTKAKPFARTEKVVKTLWALEQRGSMRAIIEERKLYGGVVCTCFEYAGHRLRGPMRRPSKSPNSRRTESLRRSEQNTTRRAVDAPRLRDSQRS